MPVSIFGSDFYIKKSKMHEAYKKLYERFSNNKEVSSYLDECSENGGSLCHVFEHFGFNTLTNQNGDIYCIDFPFNNWYVDHEKFLKVIAPYVESGSYIIFRDQDGDFWCSYFDGATMTDHVQHVTFPSCPIDISI